MIGLSCLPHCWWRIAQRKSGPNSLEMFAITFAKSCLWRSLNTFLVFASHNELLWRKFHVNSSALNTVIVWEVAGYYLSWLRSWSAHGLTFGELCDVKVLFHVDYYTDIGRVEWLEWYHHDTTAPWHYIYTSPHFTQRNITNLGQPLLSSLLSHPSPLPGCNIIIQYFSAASENQFSFPGCSWMTWDWLTTHV